MKLTIIAALVAILTTAGAVGTAEAAVYCTAAGVPKGCVARPGAGAGAAGAGVTPGAGAPGVGASPGVGVNRGGPVNRAGVR